MADADWQHYKRLRGQDLPARLTLPFGAYELERTFKNDFYAATGVYRRIDEPAAAADQDGFDATAAAGPARVVHKVYHVDRCGPLPLGWLGRALARRERHFAQAAAGIAAVPATLAELGANAFVRTYVEGLNLREHRDAGGVVGPEFFPLLGEALAALHERGVCHNDLGKPENILVDPQGFGWIIDFQIALRPAAWPLGLGWLFGGLARKLQAVDRYHLKKNWRRARPQDFTEEQRAAARQRGLLLSLHYHVLRNPYRAVRHFVLRNFLMAR